MKTEQFPRPLTTRESEVLQTLLSFEFNGCEELRGQAGYVTVVGRCGCGCASIDLDVDRSETPSSKADSPIPAEGTWHIESGDVGGGIILLLDDGWLSYLEIYGNSDDPPAEFPPPHRIEFFLNK
jgi:hypothetical protein